MICESINACSCQDKAYTNKGLLGSLKEQGFDEFWNDGRGKFNNINPAGYCRHHYVAKHKNQMLQEYLSTDP